MNEQKFQSLDMTGNVFESRLAGVIGSKYGSNYWLWGTEQII